MILKSIESLSCVSFASPSPERTRGAALRGTGSHDMESLSGFWKRSELCEWAELGCDPANVCIHVNVSAVPTQMGKCSKTDVQNY